MSGISPVNGSQTTVSESPMMGKAFHSTDSKPFRDR